MVAQEALLTPTAPVPRPQHVCVTGGTETLLYRCSLIQRRRLQGFPGPFLLD